MILATPEHKEAIKEWLIKQGANPGDTLLKCEVLEMVKKYSRNSMNNYVIDKIAADNGHQVIRLPPYHCQYNPIELIWGQVKNFIAKKNTFKMVELKTLLQEALNSVTQENWANAVRHAKQL